MARCMQRGHHRTVRSRAWYVDCCELARTGGLNRATCSITPLLCVLRASPKPIAVILRGVGNAVAAVAATQIARRRGRLVCFLISAFATHRAIGQACKAPSRLAFLGGDWWALRHHSPRQASSDADGRPNFA